jgi:hypothetical protein
VEIRKSKQFFYVYFISMQPTPFTAMMYAIEKGREANASQEDTKRDCE